MRRRNYIEINRHFTMDSGLIFSHTVLRLYRINSHMLITSYNTVWTL